MVISSKTEAALKGAKFYFTNMPCRNGHISLRRTKKGSCLECEKNKPRAYLVNNRDHHLQRQRTYNRNYYALNPQEQTNRVKKYKSENKGLAAANQRKRDANKLKRTPKWANIEAIREFYKSCPNGMEVDHIIPLQGKLVSGLHVINNLQYLTKSENCKKNNNFDPELLC